MALVVFVLVLGLLVLSNGNQISGVFTSIESIVYSNVNPYSSVAFGSQGTWIATVGWSLDFRFVNPGDTFKLTLPCVYDFNSDLSSLNLIANGASYANCILFAGELLFGHSELQCTVTLASNQDTLVFGSIEFPVAFNQGFGGSQVDMWAASSCSQLGPNSVTWWDGIIQLSIPVRLSSYSNPNLYTDPSMMVIAERPVFSLKRSQYYLLGAGCSSFVVGGSLDGTYTGTIGMSFAEGTIDCGNSHVGASNSFNSWHHPQSSSGWLSYSGICLGNSWVINYKAKIGYRVFMDVLLKTGSGLSNQVYYTNSHDCVALDLFNLFISDYSTSIIWNQVNIPDESNPATAINFVTTKWFGEVERLQTLPYVTGAESETILVELPLSMTTIQSTWTGSQTTLTSYGSGDTATVIINHQIPISTTTITWNELSTTTKTFNLEPGETAVVEVDIPIPTITHTKTTEIDLPSTTTFGNTPGNTAVVDVFVPTPSRISYSTWSNSITSASTILEPGGTNTIIIFVPTPKTTVTSTWGYSFQSTKSNVASIGGTETVIIEVPTPITTITSTWGYSFQSTKTDVASIGGTETVVIEVPTPITTVTSTWGYSLQSRKTDVASGGSETVIIEVPTPITTITSTWGYSFQSTKTDVASIGGTETVIIEVPTPITTVTSTWGYSFQSIETDVASIGGTETVIIEVPTPITTITSTWGYSFQSTKTDVASIGGTETVVIEVPTPITTVTSTWGYSLQSRKTDVASGGTETFIIEVPTPITTITSTWGYSFQSTKTDAASIGGTETVIIEVPTPLTITSTWGHSIESSLAAVETSVSTDSSIFSLPQLHSEYTIQLTSISTSTSTFVSSHYMSTETKSSYGYSTNERLNWNASYSSEIHEKETTVTLPASAFFTKSGSISTRNFKDDSTSKSISTSVVVSSSQITSDTSHAPAFTSTISEHAASIEVKLITSSLDFGYSITSTQTSEIQVRGTDSVTASDNFVTSRETGRVSGSPSSSKDLFNGNNAYSSNTNFNKSPIETRLSVTETDTAPLFISSAYETHEWPLPTSSSSYGNSQSYLSFISINNQNSSSFPVSSSSTNEKEKSLPHSSIKSADEVASSSPHELQITITSSQDCSQLKSFSNRVESNSALMFTKTAADKEFSSESGTLTSLEGHQSQTALSSRGYINFGTSSLKGLSGITSSVTQDSSFASTSSRSQDLSKPASTNTGSIVVNPSTIAASTKGINVYQTSISGVSQSDETFSSHVVSESTIEIECKSCRFNNSIDSAFPAPTQGKPSSNDYFGMLSSVSPHVTNSVASHPDIESNFSSMLDGESSSLQVTHEPTPDVTILASSSILRTDAVKKSIETGIEPDTTLPTRTVFKTMSTISTEANSVLNESVIRNSESGTVRLNQSDGRSSSNLPVTEYMISQSRVTSSDLSYGGDSSTTPSPSRQSITESTTITPASLKSSVPSRSNMESGFLARFYPYPLANEILVKKPDYYKSGYASNEILKRIDGVVNIDFSFDSSVGPSIPEYGLVYGYNISTTNFTLELTGLFMPPLTGDYTLEFANIADGIGIFISHYDIYGSVLQKRDNSYFSRRTYSDTAVVPLTAGELVPIRIVYVNTEASANLDFKMIMPNGLAVNFSTAIFEPDYKSQDYNFSSSSTVPQTQDQHDLLSTFFSSNMVISSVTSPPDVLVSNTPSLLPSWKASSIHPPEMSVKTDFIEDTSSRGTLTSSAIRPEERFSEVTTPFSSNSNSNPTLTTSKSLIVTSIIKVSTNYSNFNYESFNDTRKTEICTSLSAQTILQGNSNNFNTTNRPIQVANSGLKTSLNGGGTETQSAISTISAYSSSVPRKTESSVNSLTSHVPSSKTFTSDTPSWSTSLPPILKTSGAVRSVQGFSCQLYFVISACITFIWILFV